MGGASLMSDTDDTIFQQLTFRAPDFSPPEKTAGKGKEAFAQDTREPYQRDLGRIIHSASFRRLQTKTQVMGTGEGDFHRTRLTHSLEVGQIGRGIVWKLNANSAPTYLEYLPSTELIEAICYAHDIGHPPYGHGGERALHAEMKNYGGFEGNAQTLRVLTRLEKYYKAHGTKPTRRLLLGLLKYPVAYSEYGEKALEKKPPKCFYDEDVDLIARLLAFVSENDAKIFRSLGDNAKPKYKSFDCSIMELADDIAYGVHDLEDGIGRGVLRREEIGSELLSGFSEAGINSVRDVKVVDLLDKLFSSDTCERKHAISLLVGYFVTEVEISPQNNFESPFLDLQATVPLPTRKLLDHLSKEITFKSIVRRREVQTLEYKGEKIIADLFRSFAERPLLLVGKSSLDPFDLGVGGLLERAENEKVHWMELPDDNRRRVARAICDFIAGMTNPYAEKYHRRLFEPGFGSSTDEL